ncbi:MAG: glycosyltransferase, partial [Pseudomonadota bacterium]
MTLSTDHRAHDGDARHRLNPAQTIVALSALMILATCLWVAPIGTLQACVGLSLVSSAAFLVLRLASALTTMFDLHVGTSTDPHRDSAPREDRTKQSSDIPLTDLPTFTLLCPAYHEHDSINNLIRTLKCLDYPKDKVEVLLLLEANDQKTLAAITEDLGHIQIVIRPEGAGPQTKPAALNYGLARSSGSIVGIYDAEDRPEREQLSVIARVMQADPRAQCVQAHLNYHNREETFITRMFALEYSLHFDYVLPGLLKLGLPI